MHDTTFHDNFFLKKSTDTKIEHSTPLGPLAAGRLLPGDGGECHGGGGGGVVGAAGAAPRREACERCRDGSPPFRVRSPRERVLVVAACFFLVSSS